MEGLASSRAEVETWTLEELIRAHMLLDYKDDVHEAMMPKGKK